MIDFHIAIFLITYSSLVVSASGLKPKIGGRNPQVHVTYAGQKNYSHVIQNTCNPEWNFVNQLYILSSLI